MDKDATLEVFPSPHWLKVRCSDMFAIAVSASQFQPHPANEDQRARRSHKAIGGFIDDRRIGIGSDGERRVFQSASTRSGRTSRGKEMHGRGRVPRNTAYARPTTPESLPGIGPWS